MVQKRSGAVCKTAPALPWKLLFANLGSDWTVLREITVDQIPILKPTEEVLKNILAIASYGRWQSAFHAP